jgi:hypothetical protein
MPGGGANGGLDGFLRPFSGRRLGYGWVRLDYQIRKVVGLGPRLGYNRVRQLLG